jgi:hypothetical protein
MRGPNSLTVPDNAGFALRLGMKGDDLFEENGFRAGNIFDGLTRHGVGKKADKITGMPGFKSHANFAVGFEAANAWAMASTGIDDHERPALGVDVYPFRRKNAH